MNGNYDWQKHQANERLQARFNTAEIHRSLKQGKERESSSYLNGRFAFWSVTGIAAFIKRLMPHDRSQMINKKRFTLLSFLLILGLFLAACDSQTVDIESIDSVQAAADEEVIENPIAPPPPAKLNDSRVRPADGMTMVYMPEGSFPMGREKGFSGEKPVHEVSHDAFWIDGTEVTNGQYALCANDGSCEGSEYADDSDYNGDNYPVVGVSWFDAKAYCEWADARLPTEAEWEYVARGPEGLEYPWGEGFDGDKANSCDTHCSSNGRDERIDDGNKFTAPVGSFPAGRSWAGALDMSGNVGEWVMDWYDDAYYTSSSAHNPQGPDSGEFKAYRGGAWGNKISSLRSAARAFANPDERASDIGFRCVTGTGNM